jgi:hypothetical protein
MVMRNPGYLYRVVEKYVEYLNEKKIPEKADKIINEEEEKDQILFLKVNIIFYILTTIIILVKSIIVWSYRHLIKIQIRDRKFRRIWRRCRR